MGERVVKVAVMAAEEINQWGGEEELKMD